MDDFNEKPPRRASVPSLIGWLSLCLLTAAWGHSLDERWQAVWADMGAFGLVAAAGLGALETARNAHEKNRQERLLQTRLECGLARLNEHSATIDAINAAVRRLTDHVEGLRRVRNRSKNPSATRIIAWYPLEVMPIEEHGPTLDTTWSDSIRGFVRQMSSRAVSFEHSEAFATHLVLLTFSLGHGEQLSFVVDVMWTEKSGDAFISGGTILAVGVPNNRESEEVYEAATRD
jgi:hypothetical protein